MGRSRRVGLLFCGVALACWATSAAVATVLDVQQAAPTSPGDWAGDVVNSHVLKGPVVASGHIVDASAKPTSGEVVLFAWPNDAAMESMKIGGEVKLIPVARATTAPDGSFELRVDPAVSLESVLTDTDRGLTGNFDLVARSGEEKSLPVSIDAVVERSATGISLIKPSEAISSRKADTRPPVFEGDLSLNRADPPSRTEEGIPSAPFDKIGCTTTKTSEYSPVYVTVGETHTSPESTAKYTTVPPAASAWRCPPVAIRGPGRSAVRHPNPPPRS